MYIGERWFCRNLKSMNLYIPYVSDRNQYVSLSLFLWNEEFPDIEREWVWVCVGTWKIFRSHGKNDTSIKGFNVVQHITYI